MKPAFRGWLFFILFKKKFASTTPVNTRNFNDKKKNVKKIC